MPDLTIDATGTQWTSVGIVKHMIIISDGDPFGPAPNLLSQCIQQNIVISTVAVGTGGPPTKPLQRIATATGASFNVTNPRALPKIFQREARKVAKPLIVENPKSMSSCRVGRKRIRRYKVYHQCCRPSVAPPPLPSGWPNSCSSPPNRRMPVRTQQSCNPASAGPRSSRQMQAIAGHLQRSEYYDRSMLR